MDKEEDLNKGEFTEKTKYREYPLVDEYVNLINSFFKINEDGNSTIFTERLEIIHNVVGNPPFLSIITRTQGTRLLELSEMLLCLSGQTNTNFEIIIIGHKLTNERIVSVAKILSGEPDWLRDRIRFLTVDEGTRAYPLHVGFMEAKGEYIAILDDDDLVLDNWVETFFNLAKDNIGKILHTYVVTQQWRKISIFGVDALQAYGSPNEIYCKKFNLLDQFYINNCPSMSYVIPRRVYAEIGIQFDLSLNVLEDWDFLMRTAIICGVIDIPVVTAIYRLWENQDTSYSLHDNNEWERTKQVIINKLNEMPIILPPYSIQKIINIRTSRELLDKSDIMNEPGSYIKCIPTVYFSENDRFSENNTRIPDSTLDGKNEWSFTLPHNIFISAVRVDPGEEGMVMLLSFQIELNDRKGERIIIGANNIETNGMVRNEKIYFLNGDPQIIIHFNVRKQISTMRVRYLSIRPTWEGWNEVGLRIPLWVKLRNVLKKLVTKFKRAFKNDILYDDVYTV